MIFLVYVAKYFHVPINAQAPVGNALEGSFIVGVKRIVIAFILVDIDANRNVVAPAHPVQSGIAMNFVRSSANMENVPNYATKLATLDAIRYVTKCCVVNTECLCIVCDINTFLDVQDTCITQESVFIRLSDCHCIIEVSAMDKWMKTLPTRGFFLRCPKGSGPVLKSRRYKDIIKTSLFVLHETHKETYGTEHGRRIVLMKLKSMISDLSSAGCTDREKERLRRCLETEPSASLDYLNSVKTRIKYFSCILNIERFVQMHIQSNASFDNIHAAMNSLSKYRDLLAQEWYRGFHSEHFWEQLGHELTRLEYLFKFAYIMSLRTRVSFSEAVVSELPKIPAYLDDPSTYDKVRLLFHFASASALASGVFIPPLESLNL
ncbi:hypothetical protein CHS0354_027162 [Potamilus streckersoni]|uniref:Uncharacterized protein n=1 Tax=Potamilus streckersoni TaxID=2493646 RepID=A0AAE0TK53_9BIVA|nr:hypothetical protein CHS0354_027162 [Potamilus streckersoni]